MPYFEKPLCTKIGILLKRIFGYKLYYEGEEEVSAEVLLLFRISEVTIGFIKPALDMMVLFMFV